MTENKAQVLNFVVGCVVTWGCAVLLDAVGASTRFQFLPLILGLVVFPFMVGVITNHYHRKAEAEGKDPDERFR
jgi:Zn-dependent protease with chaperone function